MNWTSSKPVEILLVEDNPGDVLLTQVALKDSKVLNNLYVVADGVAAMSFLKKDAKYRDMPTPDLILLDLNLPKKNGREVLAEVKNDISLKHIPVAILSSSKDEEEILKTYKLHANCYITKPVDLEGFTKIVKAIEDFWFVVAKLPKV
jgi:two-component system, chemotaxis family, response regulator Rcp1